MSDQIFVSVDVEAAGPYPGEFSLLSIGACDVDRPDIQFEALVRPVSDRVDPEAIRVTGLSMEYLHEAGLPPAQAMSKFADWLLSLGRSTSDRIFVGLNAPFDWAFVNHYFWTYHSSNPFGFAALDIKAYFMGATGCSWRDTRSSVMAKLLKPKSAGDHNALHDALYQAELFRLMRKPSFSTSINQSVP